LSYLAGSNLVSPATTCMQTYPQEVRLEDSMHLDHFFPLRPPPMCENLVRVSSKGFLKIFRNAWWCLTHVYTTAVISFDVGDSYLCCRHDKLGLSLKTSTSILLTTLSHQVSTNKKWNKYIYIYTKIWSILI
jgi:hypothetical protein